MRRRLRKPTPRRPPSTLAAFVAATGLSIVVGASAQAAPTAPAPSTPPASGQGTPAPSTPPARGPTPASSSPTASGPATRPPAASAGSATGPAPRNEAAARVKPVAAAQDGPCSETATVATIGDTEAAILVDAYLDASEPISLSTVAELRRIVADARGRVRVDLHLARGSGPTDPLRDDVRSFAAAMATRGRLERALRQVARDGHERVAARLGTAQTRRPLAADVDLAPDVLDRALADRCATEAIGDATAALERATPGEGPNLVRLPMLAIGGRPFDDNPSLERTRAELGRLGMRTTRVEPPPATSLVTATSALMRRPALRGMLLGGIGLPHRFVVQARDEDDANLFMMLPTVLDYRRQHPGKLAVHIVARGSSLGAAQLRHRLCAARLRGREVAYVEYLAADPARRERPSHDVVEMLEALDAVAERKCEEEPDPAELDLPDGAWLDGLPRGRAELANLDVTLRLLAAARRPWSFLLWSADD